MAQICNNRFPNFITMWLFFLYDSFERLICGPKYFLHRQSRKRRRSLWSCKGNGIAILIENMYQEQEFWYPYYRMKEAGAKVTVIGTGAKEYHSKIGLLAIAEMNRRNWSKQLISMQ